MELVELSGCSFRQDTLLTLQALQAWKESSSVPQAECVGACPALPATEMSICSVLTSGLCVDSYSRNCTPPTISCKYFLYSFLK